MCISFATGFCFKSVQFRWRYYSLYFFFCRYFTHFTQGTQSMMMFHFTGRRLMMLNWHDIDNLLLLYSGSQAVIISYETVLWTDICWIKLCIRSKLHTLIDNSRKLENVTFYSGNDAHFLTVKNQLTRFQRSTSPFKRIPKAHAGSNRRTIRNRFHRNRSGRCVALVACVFYDGYVYPISWLEDSYVSENHETRWKTHKYPTQSMCCDGTRICTLLVQNCAVCSTNIVAILVSFSLSFVMISFLVPLNHILRSFVIISLLVFLTLLLRLFVIISFCRTWNTPTVVNRYIHLVMAEMDLLFDEMSHYFGRTTNPVETYCT